jgi:hypothetical protein
MDAGKLFIHISVFKMSKFWFTEGNCLVNYTICLNDEIVFA